MNQTDNSIAELPEDFTVRTFRSQEDPKLLKQIGCLRVAVWRQTGSEIRANIEDGIWLDDLENDSLHLAIFAGDDLAAASRLTICSHINQISPSDWFDDLQESPEAPIGFISRLVVAQKYQGQGLGSYLDNLCIQLAKEAGAASAFCDVPTYRVKTLLRMGFRTVGQPKAGRVLPEVRWAAMLLPL